jgi:uncharacterized protein (TIGR03083 family)
VPIPYDLIDMLADTFGSISALGAELSEPEWKRTTDLPGWTVQDNLSHLIGTERSLQGLPATEHRAGERDYVKNPIGEWNESEIDARRTMTGAEVLAEWNELTALRLTTLRAGDEAYFATPTVTPTGPGTVADFLSIRVLDCWSHEQDIRRAVDRPGAMGAPSAAHTIDRLVRTLGIVVGKRAGTPEGGAVAIDITGPVPRSLVFEVRDGRASAVTEPSAPPLATVRLDTETFAILALGRRPASDLDDRINIDGDTALGDAVVCHLNMMI